jgi:RNA polymerase sporulation-specific sigma factor
MPSEELVECLLEDLVKRYLQGDGKIGEQLLSNPTHRQRVERIARKYTTGTSISWEEAAQEAHLKILQAATNGKFREGGVREFYSWAAAIAQNAIIDIVRKEKRRRGGWIWESLDKQIPGTDMTLWETIADDFNLSDAVELADLVLKVREAIETIDQRYPKKGYLKLWKGMVQENDQSQLAAELGVSRSEISKRRKELLGRIAEHLGLLQPEQVKRELQDIRQGRGKGRTRSDTQW